jgi:hypothetical protein
MHSIILSLACCIMSGLVWAAEPSHVLVDASKPETTIYIGVSKTLPAENFQKLKETLAQRNDAFMLTWEEFKLDPAKHILPKIQRNDYAEVDVVRGMTSLIERFDGAPFGLTWNGGLAITGNDYAYSNRSYKAFKNDSSAFSREPDRRKDPVHPANHIEPLLRK